MDTVWIRLNAMTSADKYKTKPEVLMFGPTGIVRFFTESDGTTKLINSSGITVAQVFEDADHILDVLKKMRGTQGRLDGKEKIITKKAKSPRAAQKRQTKSKV